MDRRTRNHVSKDRVRSSDCMTRKLKKLPGVICDETASSKFVVKVGEGRAWDVGDVETQLPAPYREGPNH